MWKIVRRRVGAGWWGLALLCAGGPLSAQADSGQAAPIALLPRPGHPRFTGRDGAATGVLLVSAALLDGTIRSRALADRSARSNAVADAGNRFGTLQFAAPALGAAWLTGVVLGEPSVSDASLKALAAGALAGGVTAVLKVGFGRVRPRDGGDPDSFRPFTSNASFPSGHTTLAVAMATSLAHSTPDGWSDVVFYGAAALTGFARINDDKHWLSDVVGGAVIGFLVGRRFHHDGGPGPVEPVIGPGLFGVSLPLGSLAGRPGGHTRAR